MSALGGFRAVGAAAARLVADVLDGPELCVHDLSEDPEWSRGWDRGWRSAEEAYGVGRRESSSAEETRHSQTPGEVSGGPQSPDPSPSPGGYSRMPDSELLARAADDIDALAVRMTTVRNLNDLLNLADELRDRAAQFAALESLDTP